MNDSSLPVETLTAIIGNLISGDPSVAPENLSDAKYIPRSYLTPLLRVSKRWHAISVKYLYQSMGCDNQETSEALYSTLEANSQMAALVDRLHLGIECKQYAFEAYGEQIRTNTNILQLCPNVKHVEICGYEGFDDSKVQALVDVLKTKSLTSFSISQRDMPNVSPAKGISFSQLCDMMQKWPKLRSIQVECVKEHETEDPVTQVSSQMFGCCPDLREIVIYHAALHASDYAALRAMCTGGVTKLAISLFRTDDENIGDGKVDALCECLRAWSSSLKNLKIDVYEMDYLNSYQPLDEAIATLGELQQLQIGRMKMDLGIISNLPRLERVACLSHFTDEEMQPLPSYLEDPGKFPSLNSIVLSLDQHDQLDERLRDVCHRRNIQLHEYEVDKRSWITVCPIIDVFSGSVDWH